MGLSIQASGRQLSKAHSHTNQHRGARATKDSAWFLPASVHFTNAVEISLPNFSVWEQTVLEVPRLHIS